MKHWLLHGLLALWAVEYVLNERLTSFLLNMGETEVFQIPILIKTLSR